MKDMSEANVIYNEDCLVGMDRIANGSIDMILCDLPYGTTQCKWDSIIPFDALWKHYERIIKPNGAIVLTAAEPFASVLIVSKIDLFKYDWIWEKPHPKGHLNAKKMPMRAHEHILVFYKKTPKYNPQMTQGHLLKVATKTRLNTAGHGGAYGSENYTGTYESDKRYPRSVQVFPNATEGLHPTQKPVALFEYLIKTYTNEGDAVLDNCMGSGTTAIACINTNRKYIGFEMDPDYYKIANDRVNERLKPKVIELPNPQLKLAI